MPNLSSKSEQQVVRYGRHSACVFSCNMPMRTMLMIYELTCSYNKLCVFVLFIVSLSFKLLSIMILFHKQHILCSKHTDSSLVNTVNINIYGLHPERSAIYILKSQANHTQKACFHHGRPLQVIGVLSLTATFFFICFLLCLWKRTPTIHNLQNKHVLITGGSSGIGLEIAKQALVQGSYVTIISRNLSNLQKAVEEILQETGCERDRINIKVLISLQQEF